MKSHQFDWQLDRSPQAEPRDNVVRITGMKSVAASQRWFSATISLLHVLGLQQMGVSGAARIGYPWQRVEAVGVEAGGGGGGAYITPLYRHDFEPHCQLGLA